MQRGRRTTSQRRLTVSLYGIALTVLFLDQISKAVILDFFSKREAFSIPIIESIFHLTLVHNPGIAFGFFQKTGLTLTIPIFLCVILLLIFSVRLHKTSRPYQLAYGLVMGGAIGNFIDRLRFGYVVDFFDFRIWPVFNIADSAITVGIMLLMYFTLTER